MTIQCISWFLTEIQVPNMIIITQSDNEKVGQHQAYLADAWLTWQNVEAPWTGPGRTRQLEFSGSITGMHWIFDGNFQNKKARLTIDKLPHPKDSFNIRDMMVYPIEYAEEGLEDALRARGEMFWQCRHRNYVCYLGEFSDGIHSNVSYTMF